MLAASSGELAPVAAVDGDGGDDLLAASQAEALRIRDLLKFEFFFRPGALPPPAGRRARPDRPGVAHGRAERGWVRATLLQHAGELMARRTLQPFFDAQLVVAEQLVSLGEEPAEKEAFSTPVSATGTSWRSRDASRRDSVSRSSTPQRSSFSPATAASSRPGRRTCARSGRRSWPRWWSCAAGSPSSPRSRRRPRMNPLATRLAEIQAAPDGDKVAAFFDYDGTLIEGFSVSAIYRDRIRRLDVGLAELAQTLLIALRGVENSRTTPPFSRSPARRSPGRRTTRCWPPANGSSRSRRPRSCGPRCGRSCGPTRRRAPHRHRLQRHPLPDRTDRPGDRGRPRAVHRGRGRRRGADWQLQRPTAVGPGRLPPCALSPASTTSTSTRPSPTRRQRGRPLPRGGRPPRGRLPAARDAS